MDLVIAGSTRLRALGNDALSRTSIELSADATQIGVGTIVIDDTAGADADKTGRQCKVSEGVALLSNGFLAMDDTGRGLDRAQPHREDTWQVQDANALLYGTRFLNRSRPAETDRARVLAFAAADLASPDTTYVLNTNTVSLAAKVYTGSDWTELIQDVSEATGKTIFLHDKANGTGRCLHSHKDTEGHACGLSISDAVTTNGPTVWVPHNPNRNRSAGELSNNVMGRDQDNRTSIHHDATSETDHDADGLLHQSIIEFETASASDLSVKTAAYLAERKSDELIYTCSIGPLDQTALTKIRQGDRITITSQAMGLSASTIRISHMTLTPSRGQDGGAVPGYWDAALELQNPIRIRGRGTSGSAPVTQNDLKRALKTFTIANDCAGPDGQITDTFNRSAESDGWGIGTGGYEEGGFAPTEYTDGSHGVLDTTGAVSTVKAGPAGPTGLGAPSPAFLDQTWAFSANKDLASDFTGAWQTYVTAHGNIYAWTVTPILIGELAGNYAAIILTGLSGAATTHDFRLVIPSKSINDTVSISFSKNSPCTIRIVQTATTITVYYNGVVMATHSGSYGVNEDVRPLATAYGRTVVGGELVFSPPNSGREDIITLVDYIEIVGYPHCAPEPGRMTEQDFTGDGTTVLFTADHAYTAGTLHVEVNGTDVTDSISETSPSGGTFTFAHAPLTGAEIHISYLSA